MCYQSAAGDHASSAIMSEAKRARLSPPSVPRIEGIIRVSLEQIWHDAQQNASFRPPGSVFPDSAHHAGQEQAVNGVPVVGRSSGSAYRSALCLPPYRPRDNRTDSLYWCT